MELTPLKKNATNVEFIQWAASECRRAATLPKDEACELGYVVKTIFDKRFQNPAYCPTCGRKQERE